MSWSFFHDLLYPQYLRSNLDDHQHQSHADLTLFYKLPLVFSNYVLDLHLADLNLNCSFRQLREETKCVFYCFLPWKGSSCCEIPYFSYYGRGYYCAWLLYFYDCHLHSSSYTDKSLRVFASNLLSRSLISNRYLFQVALSSLNYCSHFKEYGNQI